MQIISAGRAKPLPNARCQSTRTHEYRLLKIQIPAQKLPPQELPPLPIPRVAEGRKVDQAIFTDRQGRPRTRTPAEGAQLPRLRGPRPSREAQPEPAARRPRPGFQNGNKPGPAPGPEDAGRRRRRVPPPGEGVPAGWAKVPASTVGSPRPPAPFSSGFLLPTLAPQPTDGKPRNERSGAPSLLRSLLTCPRLRPPRPRK